jgi:ferredoxin-thioredoxin reductase catalytic subunit/rhodanese-related sulfurtransferase
MKNIDMNSPEFQVELEKTKQFADKVITQFNFAYNPEKEINEGVIMGLARNKLIYGKRYCPCFMVIGQTDEERKNADNRICPCKPALEEEIPQGGKCHCGIFCTPEYAKLHSVEDSAEEASHTHSRGLTKEEAEFLVQKSQIDADELESLLEARKLGMVDFKLVDCREAMEYQMARIVGTDKLMPTSRFYAQINEMTDWQNEQLIIYCHTGSRSYQVQQAMLSMGFKKVGNLTPGIIAYHGEIEKG